MLINILGDGLDHDVMLDAATQADGKILLGGYSWTATYNAFSLLRFNPEGTLDQAFGVAGAVLIPMGSGFGEKIAK